MTVEQIISAFDRFDGKYKREEMEEALTLKEEITPHLIRILEDVAADSRTYVAEGHYANVYAVVLLAYFQEPRAHLPIIHAFCINDEDREVLWGDMVTETLPALLFLTCGVSLKAIKELVLNKEAYDFVRSSAVEALTYAVARSVADRGEVVEFFSRLFTGTEAEEDSWFWGSIAGALADLHPAEVMDVIRRAYNDGLIYDQHVGLEEIEEDALKDQDEVLGKLRSRVDYRLSADIHSYLSWFACFREEKKMGRTLPASEQSNAHKNKKETKRTKRKIIKASKRKNRR